ncbi:hypothetical protein FQR65_LT04309 [Abscondita terminalis]|nr:hypothetical protein FQR65_LT04309 [Abscondita terminalis]
MSSNIRVKLRKNISTLKFLFACFVLIIYCEWIHNYIVFSQCDWPHLSSNYVDLSAGDNEKEVRALVITDTHLLGSTNSYWLDKVLREWQMYRAFQTAVYIHQPDVVFILGDLTDEGQYCDEKEFEEYIERFRTVFAVPSDTEMYVVVGNHDTGFHYRITPHLNKRFVNGFNSSDVRIVTIRGNLFILVNSMALEGDGCFLCKAAEVRLAEIEKTLKCLKYNHTCSDTTLKKYSRPILITHFPLYRQNEEQCNEPDEAPYLTKIEEYKEGWDCLSKNSTYKILNQIEPKLVLNGHSHHGCTLKLPVGDGEEITISSFNWRNKNNPSYGLFVFGNDNYAFYKCLMPRQSSWICFYVLGGSILFLCTSYGTYLRKRARGCISNAL